jgi:hypothetical protein
MKIRCLLAKALQAIGEDQRVLVPIRTPSRLYRPIRQFYGPVPELKSPFFGDATLTLA